MLLRLDTKSAQPIFEQITFQVKSAIARGELREGDRLASVRELARELAINPNTVARAYETLEAQNVIVRRQGAGCFVMSNSGSLRTDLRKKKLDEVLQRAVVEGFHLGFDGDALRAAFEKQVRAVAKRAEDET